MPENKGEIATRDLNRLLGSNVFPKTGINLLLKRKKGATRNKMPAALSLYLDDSGTRHPSRNRGKAPSHGHDWFSLGGVLIDKDHEEQAADYFQQFLSRWPYVNAPLHSSEIRSQNGAFQWLRSLSAPERESFYEEVYLLMKAAPVIGIACVIDRPGYRARYLDKYHQQPWLLCKTAFAVVVERAAKYAREHNKKLRVFPERCNKTEDRNLTAYYRQLRAEGMPFERTNSAGYEPLSAQEFNYTLYDIKFKPKANILNQLADLYLWPMSIGGYDSNNRTYSRLLADGKLIEARLPQNQWATRATKYSCFENVARRP